MQSCLFDLVFIERPRKSSKMAEQKIFYSKLKRLANYEINITMITAEFSFKRLLNILLVLFVILFVIGFSQDPNKFFNLTTLFLDLALTISLLFFNNIRQKYSSVIGDFLILMNMFFVLPRLVSYIFFSDYITLPFSIDTSVKIINKGLLLYTLSIFMLFTGLYAARFFNKKKPSDIKDFYFNPFYILLIGILFFIVDFYVNYFWVDSFLIKPLGTHEYNTLIQIFKAFFAFDTVVFGILTLIFIRKNPYKDKKFFSNAFKIAFIFFILYQFYALFFGSRGGPIRVLIEFICIYLILKNNFPYRKGGITKILLAIFVLSLITFPLGNLIRSQIVANQSLLLREPLKSNEITSNEITSNEITSNEINLKIKQNFSQIFDRLGIVDYAILLPFTAYDSSKMKQIINFKYIAKSTVNTFLPGNVFSEAPLITSRAINVIYRGYSIDFIQKNGYFSEYWTSPALLFILFGFFSIPLHFALGFLMEYFYLALENSSLMFKQQYCALYLFLVPIFTLFTMGFEHTLLTLTVHLLQFSVFFFIISFIVKTSQKLRNI